MAYCTVEEFVLRIQADEAVQQSSWEPSSLFANTAFLEAHLEAASTRIDSEISIRYTVPIDPAPPQLRQIALYLAWWNCELTGEIRQTVERHYEQAIDELKRLGRGELNLIAADGTVIVPIGIGGEIGSSTDRVQTFVGHRPGLESFTRRRSFW